MDNIQNDIEELLRSSLEKEDLLAKVIYCFPYPIEVFSPDGTTVLVNRTLLTEYHVPGPDEIVGKYNIFKDSFIIASGQMDAVKKAFQGETVFFHDVKMPLDDIIKRYGIRDLDVEVVYQDITLFPIPDNTKKTAYVVALMINRRVYRSKDEIEKAREYLENHWMENYDAEKAAKVACLSKSHFTKLFKKCTGITPREYHLNYRIEKLKEMLRDTNLTVAQAFAACNMDYNGHSARIFREKIGISPSGYRKLHNQKQ